MALNLSEVKHNHIICGRGQRKYNSEGSKTLRTVVELYLPKYIGVVGKTKRTVKSKLVEEVTQELLGKGMTFLKMSKNGDSWQYLTYSQARAKVAHRFRDAMRKIQSGEGTNSKCSNVKDTSRTRNVTVGYVTEDECNSSASSTSFSVQTTEDANPEATDSKLVRHPAKINRPSSLSSANSNVVVSMNSPSLTRRVPCKKHTRKSKRVLPTSKMTNINQKNTINEYSSSEVSPQLGTNKEETHEFIRPNVLSAFNNETTKSSTTKKAEQGGVNCLLSKSKNSLNSYCNSSVASIMADAINVSDPLLVSEEDLMSLSNDTIDIIDEEDLTQFLSNNNDDACTLHTLSTFTFKSSATHQKKTKELSECLVDIDTLIAQRTGFSFNFRKSAS